MKVIGIQMVLLAGLLTFLAFDAVAYCPPENEKKTETLDLKAKKPQSTKKTSERNPKLLPENKKKLSGKPGYGFMLLNPLFAHLHFLSNRFATEPDTLGA